MSQRTITYRGRAIAVRPIKGSTEFCYIVGGDHEHPGPVFPSLDGAKAHIEAKEGADAAESEGG